MSAADTLITAAKLVAGDRAKTHGEKYKNFENIATLWNAYLSNKLGAVIPLDPTDVGQMMTLMKIARTQSGGIHNDDNYIDGAGYQGCAAECAAVDRA
jgi:hypothetical protein